MTAKINTLLLLSIALLSYTCSSNKGTSSTTGWKYNNPKYGGFEVVQNREQATAPGLVFVPGGTFYMGKVDMTVDFEWNNQPRRVSVESFYIDQTEIRNLDYLEYLHWLSLVFSENPEIYKAAYPDSLVWRSQLGYNEPLVENYFKHPAYNNYPVVGVSWLQAVNYALWRTDRVNERSLIEQGILSLSVLDQKGADNFNTDAYLAGQYTGKVNKNLPDPTGRNKDGRRVKKEDGLLFPKYRLPTEAEWEYAAMAPVADEKGIQKDRGIFPWGGYRVRSTDGKSRGRLMANFQQGRGDLMGVAGSLDASGAIPEPVNSYLPNDFGLYCMAGNVNEWVLDVYRSLSFEDVDDARPFRGNVFTAPVLDSTGQWIKDSITGKMKIDTVGYVGNRPNFLIGDSRNFKDGDNTSLINADLDKERRDLIAMSDKMYDPGKGRNQEGMVTLVTNSSRVYKGGSFMDRAYWLSPGTRRFLDEAQSQKDLGFRCAMDKVGASNNKIAPKRK